MKECGICFLEDCEGFISCCGALTCYNCFKKYSKCLICREFFDIKIPYYFITNDNFTKSSILIYKQKDIVLSNNNNQTLTVFNFKEIKEIKEFKINNSLIYDLLNYNNEIEFIIWFLNIFKNQINYNQYYIIIDSLLQNNKNIEFIKYLNENLKYKFEYFNYIKYFIDNFNNDQLKIIFNMFNINPNEYNSDHDSTIFNTVFKYADIEFIKYFIETYKNQIDITLLFGHIFQNNTFFDICSCRNFKIIKLIYNLYKGEGQFSFNDEFETFINDKNMVISTFANLCINNKLKTIYLISRIFPKDIKLSDQMIKIILKETNNNKRIYNLIKKFKR